MYDVEITQEVQMEEPKFYELDLVKIHKELKEVKRLGIFVNDMMPYLIISKCWHHLGHNYSKYDLDHGQKHIEEAIIRSIKIFSWYIQENGFNEEDLKNLGLHSIEQAFYIIGVAAIFHDLFQNVDRENHHILAGEYIMRFGEENDIKDWDYKFRKFYPKYLVMLMCEEHRASFNGKFSNILCEIFNVADKDPLDVNVTIERSWEYTSKRLGTTNVNIIAKEVLNHLKDKFSSNGYLFKNQNPNGIFNQYYRNDILKFQLEIDKLNISKIKKIKESL